MKKNIFVGLLMGAMCLATWSPVSAQEIVTDMPKVIHSGPFKAGHIQGIAIDYAKRHIYCSYTTLLVKTDFEGNILGTVTGLLGHLGDLDFNAENRRIYGSLEYKNDAIGKGILQMENYQRTLENAFYIAIFDVDKIDRMGMDAEKDGIMKTVYLPTVLNDYLATVQVNGKEYEHRLGCSGIDGVSFGPKMGKTNGKQYLTVAYGIYSDIDRTDNDYQVLLQYDVKEWDKWARPISQENMHTEGPLEPNGQYFVFTGNTNYGVQNLEYDAYAKKWWMAVYRGKKPTYENYTLFAVDADANIRKQALKGVPYIKKASVITAVQGAHQNLGSTGLCSLDNGYFLVSHSYKNNEGQGSVLKLYRYEDGEEIMTECFPL